MRRPRWTPRRAAEPARGLGTALLLVGLFTALALVTRILCLDPNQSTAFWPANGALVVAMLMLPGRFAVLVAALCFCANIALNLLTEYTAFDSILYSVLNIFSSYCVAMLTRWRCGARTDLSRVRRLARFAAIAFVSAALEAAIGDTVSLGGAKPAVVFNDWLQWTLCDGFGFLLSTPAILLCLKNSEGEYPSEAHRLERWLLLGATAGLTVSSFCFAHAPFFLMIYPALILTAFRAGPAWVLASILVTAVIASGFTAHGYGPMAALSSGRILLGQDILQPFLISIFLAAVPANNALGERYRAARRLMQIKSVVEHCATHDGLTTLANRDLFTQRLGALIRSGAGCAVLFVDIDRFKHVNDTMGHGAGDELLRAFGARLTDAAGERATVARFGGDEFAILVSCDASDADPEELCTRINNVARMPFELARGPAHVSASIGLAIASRGSFDASELMRRADIALYAAKSLGRDRTQIFNDELDRSACDRAGIEADLRTALQTGVGLQLHYQSKVDANNAVRGVEALLRWRHPTRGFVPPSLVVDVAEETGLIIPLGDWILREALAFAARWPQLHVAINVSAVQLRDPGFVAETLSALATWLVPAERIELEVTETALIDDISVVNERLATLRAAGIRIALDDFGTGYSSLRHLHRCAVDRVKIDQSFVRALGESSEAAAIVKAVIQLGHAMGLQVTAEGVETDLQRSFLVGAGIDELQGYLFSKPMDERGFAAAMLAPRMPLSPAPSPRYTVVQGGRRA